MPDSFSTPVFVVGDNIDTFPFDPASLFTNDYLDKNLRMSAN